MKDVLPESERIHFIDPMQHMQPAIDRLIDDIGRRILFTLNEYRRGGTQMRVRIGALLDKFVGIYHRLQGRLTHHDSAANLFMMTDECIESCFTTAIKFLINDGFIKIGVPAASGEFKDREILDYHAAMPGFRGEKFRK